MSKKIIVAVDGTSGSGKTETFKRVAEIIGYEFIDTGLMYRAFTLLAINEKIDFNSTLEITRLIEKFNYQVKNGKPYLNGKEIGDRLRDNDIVKYINFITVVPEVRNKMVEAQRKMVLGGGFIEVGRDITSVVLTDADLKIYLDSSIEVRAKRRYEQNLLLGITDESLEGIKQAIIKRDATDKNREVGPLILTNDAWFIDNSNLSIVNVVDMVVKKIKEMELN
ncbi:(d)CMP kinase [Mesoplasma syrphidae]|uniref:Cytidylate kinase n=1 Tax=Mesoplasma syrphidae TaxID=225999 RepID=A0A2K9C5V0_9MOLU|nr:(d)CMP kinase [Mesoplasma syrphidae]AUF83667.1 (d)CMP kinase [Mesoplasma syrphidae]